MADVAEPRSDWRTCCRLITAGLPCPSSDISTAAKYSNAIAIQRCSMSFGLPHHASTRLNAAHAVTLQARGQGFESPWLHLFPLVKPTFSTRWRSELRALAAINCSSWPSALIASVVLQFGLLARTRPLAFATFIPLRVRSRIRSDSNSATIADTLNSSRPAGSTQS
jgi:hypothetical protein